MAYAALESGGYPNLGPAQGVPQQVPNYGPAPMQPLNQGQPGGFGHWSDSLTNFSDCGNCLMSCFLPCVRQAQTSARADVRSFGQSMMVFVAPVVATLVFLLVAATEFDKINKKKVYKDIPGYEDYICYPNEKTNAKVVVFVILGLTAAIIYWVLAAKLRTALRQKYNIPGSASEDCLIFAALGCCAVAQEARHTDRVVGRLPVTPLHV